MGKGKRNTSVASGPALRLYGIILPVSVMVSSVRPWKPPLKEMTADRPVAVRAIFTAFSMASAPVVNSTLFAAPLNGAISLSRSASSIYGSYAMTWKAV
jgi:hypothetical protein